MRSYKSDTSQQIDFTTDALDMIQKSTALIGIYDKTEVLRFANHAFRQAYFIEVDEVVDWQTLMRRNYHAKRGTIIQSADIDGWISAVRSRRGKLPLRTYESDLHDGRFIWVTETMRQDGSIIYVGTDVTPLNATERQLRLARDELAHHSNTDELTGISNRRHILAKLQDAVDNGTYSYVCMLDIDRFKHINDTYGHHVGDGVLLRFSQILRKTIQLKDAFGRLGGDEFLILSSAGASAELVSCLRDLQSVVARDLTISEKEAHTVTFSCGIAAIDPNATTTDILKSADLALYRAKQKGRDLIALSTPPTATIVL